MNLRKSMGGYSWLERNDEDCSGRMLRLPNIDEVAVPVKEQLIVELYSK